MTALPSSKTTLRLKFGNDFISLIRGIIDTPPYCSGGSFFKFCVSHISKYPIMDLKDKFFHESMIDIEEIQKFFREWKHLLERNPRKIPDFYGKRIRKLEGY